MTAKAVVFAAMLACLAQVSSADVDSNMLMSALGKDVSQACSSMESCALNLMQRRALAKPSEAPATEWLEMPAAPTPEPTPEPTTYTHPSQIPAGSPNGYYKIDDGTNGVRDYYVDVNGAETGRPGMMRIDGTWATAHVGEFCASGSGVITNDGTIRVSAIASECGYSSGHGGCGVAMSNTFRARYLKLTGVSPNTNCLTAKVDFPAGHFTLNNKEQSGGYKAYTYGSNPYVGLSPECANDCRTGKEIDSSWTPKPSSYVEGSLQEMPNVSKTFWDFGEDRADRQVALGVKAYTGCDKLPVEATVWFSWGSPNWYAGDVSESCTWACGNRGFACSSFVVGTGGYTGAETLEDHNNEVASSDNVTDLIRQTMGVTPEATCKEAPSNWKSAPLYNSREDACLFSAQNKNKYTFSCAAAAKPESAGKQRLCYCEGIHPSGLHVPPHLPQFLPMRRSPMHPNDPEYVVNCIAWNSMKPPYPETIQDCAARAFSPNDGGRADGVGIMWIPDSQRSAGFMCGICKADNIYQSNLVTDESMLSSNSRGQDKIIYMREDVTCTPTKPSSPTLTCSPNQS